MKDGCGVFGILRKKSATKISNLAPLKAIDCVKFRGSKLGAGFASFDIPGGGRPPIRVKIFVDNAETLSFVRRIFAGHVKSLRLNMLGEKVPEFDGEGFKVYEVFIEASPSTLQSIVDQLNVRLMDENGIKGRCYSYGRYVNVFKDVGYPLDVAAKYGLDCDMMRSDAWLAHTRQPTNSPGTTPVWSHPFSAHEVAVVHNGDISSYGSNQQMLRLAGYRSFVGTDSEVIAFMLDYLVRVRGYTLEQALIILQNPYERVLNASPLRSEVMRLMAEARGCQLDGPFTVIAGYCDGEDIYLMALVDRSKFRPIVFGEDQNAIYVASEECQIRCLSPSAEVWTPEPGEIFLASLSKGVIYRGRP
ncbi:MAG: hypothetical protein QW212_06775 [Nitrososphaerales archaeon]